MSAAPANRGASGSKGLVFTAPAWSLVPEPVAHAERVALTWYVLSSDPSVAEALSQALLQRGVKALALPVARAASELASLPVTAAAYGVAYISPEPKCEPQAIDAQNECAALLDIIMPIVAAERCACWALVSRGAERVSEDDRQAVVSAAQSSLALTLGAVTVLDLPVIPSPADYLALALALPGAGQRVMAIRHGRCYARHVSVQALQEGAPQVAREAPSAAGSDAFQVRRTEGRSGALELRRVARARAGSGEVEIEVRASSFGLFGGDRRDAAPGADELPGWGCVGVVRGLGQGVRGGLKLGGQVAALISGAASRYLTIPAGLVAALPPDQDAALAAAYLPSLVVSAFALDEVARLRAGDQVLVLGAASAVGYIVCRLAQQRGASVLAEARSLRGRQWLADGGISRALDASAPTFLEDLLQAPRGNRVDLIVNTGAALDGDLSAFLAAGAKCVELSAGSTPLRSDFRRLPGVLSGVVSLGFLLERHPEIGSTLLRGAIQTLKLLQLPAVLPIDVASVAARVSDGSVSEGAIPVLTFERASEALALPEIVPPHRIRSNATYVVAPGTSQAGLAVAHWAVQHGARYLLIRSAAPPSRDGCARINFLEREGARIVLADEDADLQQLRALLAAREFPEVRGAFRVEAPAEDEEQSSGQERRMMVPTARELSASIARRLASGFACHALAREWNLDFLLYVSLLPADGTASDSDIRVAKACWDGLASSSRAAPRVRSLGLPLPLNAPDATIDFGTGAAAIEPFLRSSLTQAVAESRSSEDSQAPCGLPLERSPIGAHPPALDRSPQSHASYEEAQAE